MEYAHRPITPPSLVTSGSVPEDPSSTTSSTMVHIMMTSEQRQDACTTPTKQDAARLTHPPVVVSPSRGVCGGEGLCDPSIISDVLFPMFYRNPDDSAVEDSPVVKDSSSYSLLPLPFKTAMFDDPAMISPNCQKRGRFLVWPAVGPWNTSGCGDDVGVPAPACRVLDSSSFSAAP